jgi:SsrA-binding protein
MKTITKNKKAYHDYEILETNEVGIKLIGPEVKSLRNGKCNLKGSFCRFMKGELWLFECHISKYEQIDGFTSADETRVRKILMSRKELNKWEERLRKEQQLTIVPLSIYFNEKNIIKLSISLVKGKKLYDKRNSDKEKTIKKKLQKGDYL